MQPMRASTQFASEGFGGSRFAPIRRQESMGAVISPAVIPVGPVVPQVVAPPIIEPQLVYPPTVITPTGQIFVAPTSDVNSDDNKVIAVLAVLGLFGLGASLF